MPQLRSGAGLQEKTGATTFICQVSRMNYFQSHFALQIRVERFIRDAHGAAAEFDGTAVISGDEFVLLESKRFRGSRSFVAQRNVQQTSNTGIFTIAGRREWRPALRANRR